MGIEGRLESAMGDPYGERQQWGEGEMVLEGIQRQE